MLSHFCVGAFFIFTLLLGGDDYHQMSYRLMTYLLNTSIEIWRCSVYLAESNQGYFPTATSRCRPQRLRRSRQKTARNKYYSGIKPNDRFGLG